jgi:3-phosphoshikimate 1-carboxyvinyltransferase
MIGALARGRSEISNLNLGGDVGATATAVTKLGAPVEVDPNAGSAWIDGPGPDRLHEPPDVIDAGNSGTTLRCLLGILSAVEGMSVVTGDESLRRRPMLRVVAPLRQLGASIEGRDHGDRAPLVVRGAELRGAEIEIPVASAQIKTALLLAGLRADGPTTVISPRPSRDHTERMLTATGVGLEISEDSISIAPGEPKPFRLRVPGDASSAAFLIVAALLVPGSDLTVTGVGLNPSRTALFDVLSEMGAEIEVETTAEEMGEPVGTIRAKHSLLSRTEVPPEAIPALVDEIPILAVAATQATGTTTIAGAGELRVKESDRLATVAAALRSLGASVEERPDGLEVSGPAQLDGGEVESAGDHRIALALAVAGLVASAPVRVNRWACVDTSFPEFLDLLGDAQGKGWKRS